MDYDGRMDSECVVICDAINRIPHVRTVESCCGHGDFPFSVYLQTDDMRYLAIVLFYAQGQGWNMRLRTDCSMQPPYIVLDSVEVGAEAYRQADVIGYDINAFMSDFEGTDEPGNGFTDWQREHIKEEGSC